MSFCTPPKYIYFSVPSCHFPPRKNIPYNLTTPPEISTNFCYYCSLIGYLVGTAIAWFVIIGDVSPAVVSSLLGIEVR